MGSISIQDIRRGKSPSSSSLNALTFFRNYNDSMPFKAFIPPYFTKESLFAVGDQLLIELYRYLASCCDNIEKHLISKSRDSRFVDLIFSWNNVPGKDNGKLLAYLKQIFDLESIEHPRINKEDTDEVSKITVKVYDAAPILIILDKARKKVEITSTEGNALKKLDYDMYMLDQEMTVGKRTARDESIKDIINDAKQKIEQLIYGFVYDLASSSTQDPEVTYYVQILSGDNRFITVLQKIYENTHEGFERGYAMLANNQ